MPENLTRNPALGFRRAEEYRRLRDVFLEAGFTDGGVLEALGLTRVHSLRADDLPLLLRKTEALTPLHCFIRLFLMEVPVALEAMAKAVRPLDLNEWAAAGLIRVEGNRAFPCIKLLPFRDLWVAFDLPAVITGAFHSQYVMGIGASSLTLANLTIRRPSRATLDLGTGCGIQALLAASHSDRVVATDRNPRARDYTEFNVKLNALDHLETRLGDLFQPLAEETFDLVVTNPPFVISPENRYIYRDSGLPQDQVCRTIVQQAPRFLNEGGYLQMLCNWVESSDGAWHDRIHSWFAGTGCNGWVLRSESLDAAAYASNWIRHTERDDPEHYARRFCRWLDHYQQQGIESFGAGLITMRRASGRPNWFVAEDLRGSMQEPCGDRIEQGFALQDFLTEREADTALLGEAYRISPQVRLLRKLEPAAGGWRELEATLELCRGLPYRGQIDSLVANILVQCDGTRPLGAVAAEQVAHLDLAFDAVQSLLCTVSRLLIRQGFLIPVALAQCEPPAPS